MNLVIRSRLRQYALLALSAILVLILITRAANNWLSYVYAGDPPPKGLKEASVLEPNNSEFYFLLAQYYDSYDASVPSNQVYSYYQKALELSPANFAYWFYLADSLFMDGKQDDSLLALNQATELAPGMVSLRWGAAMLASKMGDEEAIISNIRSVLDNDPQRRYKAYPILWQSLRNGDKIWKAIPDDALPSYLNFLISTRRLPQTKLAWHKLSGISEVPEETFLRYVSFLINENDLQYAKQIWTDRLGAWQGVWNGSFEKEPLSAGFDWRIRKVDGVNISRKINPDNGYSLKIEFEGKDHPDSDILRQVIPVNQNSNYRLISRMKSSGVTTRNGPFWEIICYGSDRLNVRTEAVSGTTDWHDVSVSFTTPQGCEYLILRLRQVSNEVNERKISGIVWIDNVELEQLN